MGGSAGAQHSTWLSSGASASMVCQVTRNWEGSRETIWHRQSLRPSETPGPTQYLRGGPEVMLIKHVRQCGEMLLIHDVK